MRQPPMHKPLPFLLLASLLLMLAITPALATADPALYYEQDGPLLYHLDATCPNASHATLPMLEIAASEFSHLPYGRLLPCHICVSDAFSSMLGSNLCNDIIPLSPDAPIASADFYTLTLAEKASAYPGIYRIPTPEDLQPEEAIALTTDAIAKHLDIPPETLAHLTPYLYFYCVISNDMSIWHCYCVQYADTKKNNPNRYTAEIISDTHNIRSISWNDTSN